MKGKVNFWIVLNMKTPLEKWILPKRKVKVHRLIRKSIEKSKISMSRKQKTSISMKNLSKRFKFHSKRKRRKKKKNKKAVKQI